MSSTEESNDLWHCHICNLDVPTSYIQEHDRSRIHKTHVAICQESLIRLTAHIATSTNTTQEIQKKKTKKYDEYDSAFFCDICSETANYEMSFDFGFIRYFNTHKDSRRHHDSNVKVKLLENFHKFYIDGSINEMFFPVLDALFKLDVDVNEEITDELKQLEDIIDKTDEIKHEEAITTDTLKIKNTEKAQANGVPKNISIVTQTVRDNTKQSSIEKTKEPVSEKEPSRVKIKTPITNWRNNENGTTEPTKEMKVDNSNVHPLKLNCRICNDEVADKAMSVETHLNSPAHVAQYMKFITKNNLKMINGRLMCLACNSYVLPKYEIFHVNSNRHKRVLQDKSDQAGNKNNEISNEYMKKLILLRYGTLKTNKHVYLQSYITSKSKSTESISISRREDDCYPEIYQ